MPVDVTSAYERMKAKLKLRLLDLLDGMPHEQDTPARRKVLEEQLLQVVRGGLSQGAQVTQFTPDQLIADPTISEVMVNGPNEIYIERDGRLERVPETFRDEHHLMSVIERM